jgi:hypothetical protein
MQTIPKANYQKAYYQAHPHLKERARERERKKRAEIKTSFANSTARNNRARIPSHQAHRRIGFEPMFLFALIALVTSILLHEMIPFYLEADGSPLFSWLKAISVEGLVIVFSAISSPRILKQFLYKVLAISICAFTIYAVSAKQVEVGLSAIRAEQIILEQIAEFSIGIAEKSTLRDAFTEKGWLLHRVRWNLRLIRYARN